MTLTEQIYAHALVLVRDMEEENKPLLEVLCRSAEVSLRAKLREAGAYGYLRTVRGVGYAVRPGRREEEG